jgi:hypothetical protein
MTPQLGFILGGEQLLVSWEDPKSSSYSDFKEKIEHQDGVFGVVRVFQHVEEPSLCTKTHPGTRSFRTIMIQKIQIGSMTT